MPALGMSEPSAPIAAFISAASLLRFASSSCEAARNLSEAFESADETADPSSGSDALSI